MCFNVIKLKFKKVVFKFTASGSLQKISNYDSLRFEETGDCILNGKHIGRCLL